MKKTYLYFLLLLFFPLFVGCTTLSNPGFPKQSYDEKEEIKILQDTFKTTEMIKTYYTTASGPRTKAMRDEIITARLLLIDKLYNRFVARSAAEKQAFDTLTDIAVIGIDLAVATVGGESVKEALGAASAGITGSKLSIDKNYYFEKTISVLITAMNAQRKVVLFPIKRGMKLPIGEYSLAEALSDLDSYYFAGTFIGALESINEDAGAKGKEAKAKLDKLSSKFIKDEPGNLLRAYWKPDGQTIDTGNQTALLEWMKRNGLEGESITFFLRSEVYEKQRLKAAKEFQFIE